MVSGRLRPHCVAAAMVSRPQRSGGGAPGYSDFLYFAFVLGMTFQVADVAIESAGITLLSGDLGGIVRARTLSRAVMRNIRQNLFWAFAYNTVGVPVAAGVLYPFFGLVLSPMIAGFMMLSSRLIPKNPTTKRMIALV